MAADGFDSHVTRVRPISRIGRVGSKRARSHATSTVTIVPHHASWSVTSATSTLTLGWGRVHGGVHQPVDRDERKDDQDRTEGLAESPK